MTALMLVVRSYVDSALAHEADAEWNAMEARHPMNTPIERDFHRNNVQHHCDTATQEWAMAVCEALRALGGES